MEATAVHPISPHFFAGRVQIMGKRLTPKTHKKQDGNSVTSVNIYDPLAVSLHLVLKPYHSKVVRPRKRVTRAQLPIRDVSEMSDTVISFVHSLYITKQTRIPIRLSFTIMPLTAVADANTSANILHPKWGALIHHRSSQNNKYKYIKQRHAGAASPRHAVLTYTIALRHFRDPRLLMQ
jgi:hypothetical protein